MLSGSQSVALVGILVAGVTTAQSPCLDQSYLPNLLTNGLEVMALQSVTQTFTVGRTGQLLQVEISRIRHHSGLSTNPLQIDVVTTDAMGTPTTISLATATVQPANIPTTIGSLLVDVSAFNIQVQTGDVLGLALASPNAAGTPSYAWWGEAPGSTYTNGQIFIQQTVSLGVWDLAFQTWVSESASWTNYGTGHPGTIGVPSLASNANPILGTTPNILVGNSANAPTVAALFFGLFRINVLTPFGGSALVQPVSNIGLALPVGGGQTPLSIPAVPSLCGFVIDMQAVVFDPGSSHGIAFTAGLEFVLGH